MKFLNFLNEGRTRPIGYNEAIKILKKNCSKSLYSTPIYRYVQDANYEYGLVDPKGTVRRSPYASSNHYNLILSNLPFWKKYPQRNASIVCTTDRAEAVGRGGGDYYRVFPFNGSKIGVCSSDDIWYSFKIFKQHSLNDLNKFLNELGIRDTNWQAFNTDVSLYIDGVDKIDLEEDYSDWLYFLNGYIKSKKRKFVLYLNKIFDPKNNGIELKKAGDTLPEEREVWTDSKCILVLNTALYTVMQELMA